MWQRLMRMKKKALAITILILLQFHLLQKFANLFTSSPSPIEPDVNIFEQRQKKLDDVCKDPVVQRNKRVPDFPHRLIVLKDDKNLAWCPVPKGGSTTWNKVLSNLSSEKEKRHELIINLNGEWEYSQVTRHLASHFKSNSEWASWLEDIHQKNESEVTMIIVRHPFERLVSAYRDKIAVIRGKHNKNPCNKAHAWTFFDHES